MKGGCDGPCCPCHLVCAAFLTALFIVSAVPWVADVAGAVVNDAAAVFGVAAVLAGLWLGFRHHGNGQPLAVGLFGLIWLLAGAWVSPIASIAGTAMLLVAAVWSALVFWRGRGEEVVTR